MMRIFLALVLLCFAGCTINNVQEEDPVKTTKMENIIKIIVTDTDYHTSNDLSSEVKLECVIIYSDDAEETKLKTYSGWVDEIHQDSETDYFEFTHNTQTGELKRVLHLVDPAKLIEPKGSEHDILVPRNSNIYLGHCPYCQEKIWYDKESRTLLGIKDGKPILDKK